MSDRPDWTLPTEITNSRINVKVEEGSIDANITNSNINTVIQDSQIIMPIQGGTYKSKSVILGLNEIGDYIYNTLGNKFYKTIYATPPLVVLSVYVYAENPDSVDHQITVDLLESPEGEVIYSLTQTISAGTKDWIEFLFTKIWTSPVMYIRITADYDYVHLYGKATGFSDFVYAPSSDQYARLQKELSTYAEVISLGQNVVPVAGAVKAQTQGFDYTNKVHRALAVDQNGVLKGLRKVTKSTNTGLLSIDAGATATILTISGRGTVKYIKFRCEYDAFQVRIYADGNLIDWGQAGFTFKPSWVYGDEQRFKSAFLSCTYADTTNNIYFVEMVQEIKFSSEFKIVVYNPDTAAHNFRVDFLIYDVEE